jgi:hypothetical protein
VGQPELEAKLAQPELRQLRQRVAIHYRLRPLTPAKPSTTSITASRSRAATPTNSSPPRRASRCIG